MFKNAKNGLLNFKNIDILTGQITIYLFNFNLNNTIVIIQKIRFDTWLIAFKLKIFLFLRN